MLDTEQIVILMLRVFALGILISLCFTFFAVNKFVNMKSNKIYLY